MMEFYLYMQTVGESPNVKELYFGSSDENAVQPQMSKEMAWMYLILFIVAAYYAVRLSWSSNTLLGYSQAAKILFAIFAFLFPFTYLAGHLVFKWDLLNLIEKKHLVKKSQI